MTDTNPEFSDKTPVQEPTKSSLKSVEKFVKYSGTATRRIITSEHWAGVNAPDMPTTEWTFGNDYKIPVSEFSAAALDYLRRDGRFQITD